MTSLPYSVWGDTHLRQHTMKVDGYNVSYWASDVRPHLPTMLLVHGITGDHHGLIPLARELYATCNIILLELPGHGNSQLRSLKNAQAFQAWFDAAFQVLAQTVGLIDWVVAHSFGCSAVLKSNRAKIILLCPVPTPSNLYSQYARIIMRLAPFWALFYSWRLFVLLRGRALRKVRTRAARRLVRWVGFQSRASYKQIIYQARLIDIILDPTAYSDVSDRVKLVIAGLEDTTARERDSAELGAVFARTPVEFLRGGHLLPIESPERTAQQIRRIL
ncbi:MAG: hypothetical protein JWM00_378 [Candidatus Saccharibacteria bacterium]|nr:hypothetical protein [Candidatus Saccharibacteria bacterium]